ncbi:Alpha/Beta hydrolase protein [Mycena leptocephala]|nr:Alpha/Beta hydrolase protein [Mycena leptocephala]
MAEYSHLSDPDPEFAPYMAQMMAIPQIFEVEARRKQTEYRLTDHQVDVENGKILVRSLIPTSKKGSDTYPLMVWMHGGGWTSGNLELDDYQLRAICVELQISILNVDYRLAPEHPHPTGLNDSYSALKWAAESSELLCADLKKGFIISGLSAGGHIAAIIAHRARDDPFLKRRNLLASLFQRYKSSLLSYEQNKHGPGLTTSSILWSFGEETQRPEVSPLLYQSHKGLVPTVIQACGLDPLRDEALLYDKLLKDEGVKTRTITYPGVPHAFQYAFPAFKIAIKWEEDYRAALRWLLDGAPPE